MIEPNYVPRPSQRVKVCVRICPPPPVTTSTNEESKEDLIKVFDLYRKSYLRELTDLRNRYGKIFSCLLEDISKIQDK